MFFNRFKSGFIPAVIILIFAGWIAGNAGAALMMPETYSATGIVDKIDYKAGYIKMDNAFYYFTQNTGAQLKKDNISKNDKISITFTKGSAQKNIIVEVKTSNTR